MRSGGEAGCLLCSTKVASPEPLNEAPKGILPLWITVLLSACMLNLLACNRRHPTLDRGIQIDLTTDLCIRVAHLCAKIASSSLLQDAKPQKADPSSQLACHKQTMHIISLPYADISNYSREDKDMLRGAGLMSQASGLGPGPARTATDAPSKVRLCRHRIMSCLLHTPASIAAQVRVLSLTQMLAGKPGPFSAMHSIWNVLNCDSVV